MTAKLAVIAFTKAELLDALANYPNSNGTSLWVGSSPHNNTAVKIDLSELISNSRYAELVQHWVNGTKIDWQQLYQHQVLPHIVSLPTYPFTKRRCWIPTQEAELLPIIESIPNPLLALADSFDSQEWLYAMQWEKNPFDTSVKNKVDAGKWLIFSDHELGLVLQQQLNPADCVYCFSGEQFEKIDDQVYYINPRQKEDYNTLFQQVYAEHGAQLKGIIYLCATFNRDHEQQTDPSLALLYLFKAIIQHSWSHALLFSLVSQCAQPVQTADSINIWQHHLWSMTRIFAAEQANYQVLMLDLDATASLQQNAQLIVQELGKPQANQNHVAYRLQERYTIRFTPELMASPQGDLPAWNAPKAALITGGLGALGYEVAAFLAAKGSQYLLLTGTTELSVHTLEKNTWLKQLEAQGIQVKYAAVDVANKEKMQHLILETEKAWRQPIDGVFHLAGVTTDNVPIAEMEETLWHEVLRVKVQGALVLHELFLEAKLNYFVLFSSIAAVPHFGMAGLSAYAVANEFLSGLALYRRSVQLPGLSINWVAWSEKGMSHRHNHDAFLEAVGMASLSIKEGISILNTLLCTNPAEITVCKMNWKKFLQVNATAKHLDFFTHFINEYAPAASSPLICSLNPEQIATLVADLLAKVLALESSELDENTPFEQYGMDSISGINYSEALGEPFPDVVSPMDLYRYPTLSQLAEHIIQRVTLPSELSVGSVITTEAELDLDDLDYNQLNELIESELKELELTYD